MNAKLAIAKTPSHPAMESRYQCAQSILQGYRTQHLVQNDNVQPNWIAGSHCFWYQRSYKTSPALYGSTFDKASLIICSEFRLVDTQSLTNETAFDHNSLALALAQKTQQAVNAESLSIEIMSLTLSPLVLTFRAFNKHWKFDEAADASKLIELETADILDNEILSPNGKWVAFSRSHNLWVRNTNSGEERALTFDGEEHYRYGAANSAPGIRGAALDAQWSPDSRRLLCAQRDTRKVKSWPMADHHPTEGTRPSVNDIKLAFVGDDNVEQSRILSISINSGQHCEAYYPSLVAGTEDFGFFTGSRRAWWKKDSRHAYFIAHQGCSYKTLRVVEFDTHTGNTRTLIEETANTYINIQPEYSTLPQHRYLPDSNELIWWSERSGSGHLYLYDLSTGTLKHPITFNDRNKTLKENPDKGWWVREIVHVDSTRRELLIQTAGYSKPCVSTQNKHRDNPYYRDLCRVHIDTGELTQLISSDDEYCIHSDGDVANPYASGVSPDAESIVVTRSRSDQVPVSFLLDRAGSITMELETADISALPQGWQWPEPVCMEAAGPDTEGNPVSLHGALFRPSHFREDEQYPVINMMVGGPWLCAVPQGSFHNSRGYADRHYFQAAALAELGFMVVIIDGRGTPLRHKAFQECNYGCIEMAADIADHRSAIEQLAQRYSSMDLTRVGIYSPTGYPGGLYNLLQSDGFYSVGVIAHVLDTRLMSRTAEHIDKYQGLEGEAAIHTKPLSAEEAVDNWEGKLLLIKILSGWASGAYPAGAFRVLQALQAANKDVDLIVRSNDSEAMLISNYEQRRAWDYLVRHLQGAEPPVEFKLENIIDI